MNRTKQISTHFSEFHFGGNWTDSNLQDILKDITWQEATAKVYSLNSIAALVFHMNYFVDGVIKVLEGEPLSIHDKYSFDLPPISSKEDWEKLQDKTFTDAEKFAGLINELPESKLWEDFSEEKYGNYYRNLHGIIEHSHYHLGQIVILKKLIRLT